MTRLDRILLRTLVVPVPQPGARGLALALVAAIVACEVRTMGMGLHRSDGRNASIADPVLLWAGRMLETVLPIL